jgi:hypothetical protein
VRGVAVTFMAQASRRARNLSMISQRPNRGSRVTVLR